MFESIKQRVAEWLAPALPVSAPPARRAQRMYAIGRPGRTTSGWGSQTTSEDTELSTSLRTARNRSRELVRDGSYAKRAKVVVQNNVIGSGIGLQAKVETSRGHLHERVNDEIESVFKSWCRGAFCHMGRSLHLFEQQRIHLGECFEAGEIFIRLHYQALSDSPVPLALEIIEPERIADQYQPGPTDPQAHIRMGVEGDSYGAPLAYWINTLHPGEWHLASSQPARVERVPARDIIHLRVVDRWPQTRAIPWMHASARKLNDMDGLTEAEITAARAAACYMGFVEPSPSGETSFDRDPTSEAPPEEELEPAMIRRLDPGEKFSSFAPNRPNSQLDPFMRMMLREVASGTGPSYESLSRDYSQSNYSSSRLALLDDRDLWRVLQQWYIRMVLEPIYRVWLRQAVLARAIRSVSVEEYAVYPEKFEAVRFKPRGWSWVDPTREVEAYKEAIRGGLTTLTHVIEQTGDGRDLEDVLKERQQELRLAEEMGLTFDTDPGAEQQTAPAQPKQPAQVEDEEDPAVQKAEKLLRHAGGTGHV